MGKRNRKKQQTEMVKEDRKNQPPMLLTLQDGQHPKIRICRPLDSQAHTICIPILVDKRILASTHGWLVLVDSYHGECCIWNPCSKETIELPTLEKFYRYNKCVMSKPPTEPDCHILFNSINAHEQAFCKIGDVKFVHQCLRKEKSRLVAIASFQGKIYGVVYTVMTPSYKFVTIEFDERTMKFRPILTDGQPWKAPITKRNSVVWHDNDLINSPTGDDLLWVTKDFAHHNFIIDGSEFRVFRIDIKRRECIELDDIGDQVILIGQYGNGFCCSSSGTNTFKPNSIYHTAQFGSQIFVYDLDDKSISSWLPPDITRDIATSCWVTSEIVNQLLQ